MTRSGAVTASSSAVAEAGGSILRPGGNAVDAAVGTALAYIRYDHGHFHGARHVDFPRGGAKWAGELAAGSRPSRSESKAAPSARGRSAQ
jgi:hypothetical protein